jgi:hypothetical protein
VPAALPAARTTHLLPFLARPLCPADIKGELLRLNRGVLFMFLELLQVLVAQPSQYSSMLSEIMGTLFNMNHLLNMARPLQVRLQGCWLDAWDVRC